MEKTKQICGRRSVAALLTLTATSLWTVPVIRAADPTNASDYRFIRVVARGEIPPNGQDPADIFTPYDVNKRGDALFDAQNFSDYGWNTVYVRTMGRVAPMDPEFGRDKLTLGYVALNDSGDVALSAISSHFLGIPYFDIPLGYGGVLYRYSAATKTTTPVAGNIYLNTSLNNKGDIVFPGIIDGADIDPRSRPGCSPADVDCEYRGLGVGVFRLDKFNKSHKVVRPGDKAPGNRVFDWAGDPWINDRGDVAFGAHLRGDPCNFDQSYEIFCPETSVYLRTGLITRSLAHVGDREPGGGIYKEASGPIVNNSGQVVYSGYRMAPDRSLSNAVYLYSGGVVRAVALAGDNMPGGGKLVSTSGGRGLCQEGAKAPCCTKR